MDWGSKPKLCNYISHWFPRTLIFESRPGWGPFDQTFQAFCEGRGCLPPGAGGMAIQSGAPMEPEKLVMFNTTGLDLSQILVSHKRMIFFCFHTFISFLLQNIYQMVMQMFFDEIDSLTGDRRTRRCQTWSSCFGTARRSWQGQVLFVFPEDQRTWVLAWSYATYNHIANLIIAPTTRTYRYQTGLGQKKLSHFFYRSWFSCLSWYLHDSHDSHDGMFKFPMFFPYFQALPASRPSLPWRSSAPPAARAAWRCCWPSTPRSSTATASTVCCGCGKGSCCHRKRWGKPLEIWGYQRCGTWEDIFGFKLGAWGVNSFELKVVLVLVAMPGQRTCRFARSKARKPTTKGGFEPSKMPDLYYHKISQAHRKIWKMLWIYIEWYGIL